MTPCPLCSKTMGDNVRRCPNCGENVSLYVSLKKIRRDLMSVQKGTSAIAGQVAHLSSNVEAVERLAANDLRARRPDVATPTESHEHPEEVPISPIRRPHEQSPPPPQHPPRVHRKSSIRQPSGNAETRFGQKVLLIVGVAVTVLGLGYFVKYAFDNNWVGPAGRVALAYLTAVAFLGVGEAFRRRRLELFGLCLIGGGIASLYLSTWAAFDRYQLIGQVPAFTIMVLITAFAGMLSLVYNTRWLAILGLIGGFCSPLLLWTGVDPQFSLMAYLTILNVGIFSLAFKKRWTTLTALGCAGTWLVFTAWLVRFYPSFSFWSHRSTDAGQFWMTLTFVTIFFLIYAVAPFLYFYSRKGKVTLIEFGVTVPNAFIAFGYSFALIKDFCDSSRPAALVSLGYAAIFLAMATHLQKRFSGDNAAIAVSIAKALALLFLVITVPIAFTGPWITIFWAALSISILWLAGRLQHRGLYYWGIAVVMLCGSKFFLHDYWEVFNLHESHLYFREGFGDDLARRWLTTGLVLFAFFAYGRVTRLLGFFLETDRVKTAVFFSVFASIQLFAVLNIETSAFFWDYARSARFAAISVLWTLFAIAMMALGFTLNSKALRTSSIALFGITIFKVLILDQQHVSTPYRIVSTMLLGIMLIGAAYLYNTYKSKLLQPDDRETSTLPPIEDAP